jgi:hypothetical protein
MPRGLLQGCAEAFHGLARQLTALLAGVPEQGGCARKVLSAGSLAKAEGQ